MKKLWVGILAFVLPALAHACPYCHPLSKKPPYTMIIIGIFILVTYVPFYVLYRSTKKYDPKNLIND